jgi:hypothetical protein
MQASPRDGLNEVIIQVRADRVDGSQASQIIVVSLAPHSSYTTLRDYHSWDDLTIHLYY